jgi:mono/diheme cytochrome c family protein
MTRSANVLRASGLGLFATALAGLSAQALLSSWSGIYTEGQAMRGAALYAENCAQCHQANLTGGDLAPPLTGPAFFSKWNDRSVAELFDYQTSTMPLNSPGGLSLEQNADLIAFMLRQGKYPSGAKELPARRESLTAVKLLATKP